MKYRYSVLQIAKKQSVDYILDSNTETKFNTPNPLSKSDLAYFESSITGKIVWPWTPSYDADKASFNDVYPANPIVIIFVASYEDVRICLQMARNSGMWTLVRSGRHSLADYSVGDGMIIDMSALTSINVNPSNKTVFVESGVTFEKLFPQLEFHGLHVPGGGCPTVAVAGFMMGGGYGLTSRTFGMNCDNVISVTVMLADGQIVVANENQNQDLFWAIRGGTGGNFGVLLNITFQLYELGDIYGVKIQWPISDYVNASKALETIQNQYLYPSRYSNLGIETVLCIDSDNIKKVMFCASWVGDKAGLDAAIAPLLTIPGADLAKQVQGKYSTVNAAVLDGTPDLPDNVKAYSRSVYIDKPLSAADWSQILQKYMTSPNDYTMVDMECYGGRINEIPVPDSSFIHRNVTMDFFCDVYFNNQTNDQKECEEWLEDFFQFMAQYGNGHSYQNYPNRNQTDYKWAYWGIYYNILVMVKKKYDPTNFFHYQQSIGMEFEDSTKQKEHSEFTSKDIVYENY